jgi:probable rRNA maturation factor
LAVEVIDPERRLSDADRAWIEARLTESLDRLGASGEARARMVGDAEMAAEHRRTMGDPTTTDVLTFDLRTGPDGPLDADLLVCVDEATRQAAAFGHDARSEVLLYALHGCLHCLGYDDVTDSGAAAMHAAEDATLRAIGVGEVFARPRPAGEPAADPARNQAGGPHGERRKGGACSS